VWRERQQLADYCLMQSPSTSEQSPAQYVEVAGAAQPSIEPVGAAVVGSEAPGATSTSGAGRSRIKALPVLQRAS
jgi:hypothetical protein